MKIIKIFLMITTGLNAMSVDKALFDLKDSQLKGDLVSKAVDIGGYKSNTKEWGASALNYINAANGDAQKFSILVEKMRSNSSILRDLGVYARLKQALKLQKDLKYYLKIIARDSFYSYRTGIYIPLGVSLKDQKTAQKMLADLSVVAAYLQKQQESQKAQSPYYRNNYYNPMNYYNPYYGMYGMGMYGMYGGLYGGFFGGYGFYPSMLFMMQVQDYLMLENYMYALGKEEGLAHEENTNQLNAPIDDKDDKDDINNTNDRDDKDDKSLQPANLMSFYRDPKFSKGIQNNRLDHALINLDNGHALKDNALFKTKAMPIKSVDAITSQAKELNHLVGQIKEMKQDGASPNKIDALVNKAMGVREKLDNNLNQLDNDLKDQKGLSNEQQTQVDKALDSVQQLSHSSDVVGNYLDGSLKIDSDDKDNAPDLMNNPIQAPINDTDNMHADDDKGNNALINPNNNTNTNDIRADTNTENSDSAIDPKDAGANDTDDKNANGIDHANDTNNTDTNGTDDNTNNADDSNNMNDNSNDTNDDTSNMNDDMNGTNDTSDDMNDDNSDSGDMGDDMSDDSGDMGDMGDMN